MRLINTRTYDLVEYSKPPPRYAILSHTWENGEVTYQDMVHQRRAVSSKRGWYKLERACITASEEGFPLLWIDTCCIDKTNSVELSESINSMFRWYKDASLCIAYLADFHVAERLKIQEKPWKDSFFTCRWWRRGWTLQELIAPPRVDFYSSTWDRAGTKMEWRNIIAQRTGIPVKILLGLEPPHTTSVAKIFSWAVDRQTTRIEDASYSLLGLFDVNMPLLYGEGSKAFQRLQEEIMKHDNDLTIFAHDGARGSGQLFATDVTDFQNSGSIVPFSTDAVDFSVTNRGLRVSGDLPIRYGLIEIDQKSYQTYFMFLGYDEQNGKDGAICVRKVGPRLFQRHEIHPLAGFGHNELIVQTGQTLHSTDWFLMSRSRSLMDPLYEKFLNFAIYLVPNERITFQEVVPHVLYDKIRQLFFRTGPGSDNRSDVVIAIKCYVQLSEESDPLEHVVLCDRRITPPQALIFNAEDHKQLTALLFAEIYRENSIPWVLLEIQYPKVKELLSWTKSRNPWAVRKTIKANIDMIPTAESPTLTPLYGLEIRIKEGR